MSIVIKRVLFNVVKVKIGQIGVDQTDVCAGCYILVMQTLHYCFFKHTSAGLAQQREHQIGIAGLILSLGVISP